MIKLLFLLSSFVMANELTYKEIRNQMNPKKRSFKKKKTVDYKSELEETKKKLESYRYIEKLRTNRPFILKESVIEEAKLIGAKTLMSIRASNLPSKVILSNLEGVNLPVESKIICSVIAKTKRICGACDRIIINGIGYDIQARLHNIDGSHCAIGELSDDGELYLTGIALSELSKGALSVSQSSIPTVGGNLVQENVKNKLIQGGINVGDEATDIFREKMRTTEPIVFLKRGKRVSIFFEKGLSL